MPARRLLPVVSDSTIVVDGKDVIASHGESCAQAIVASGRWIFGRSIKYHRPRGPACFSGDCDGCLMRVDGVPNVMTCRLPARDGLKLETQNVLGTAEADLLSATDWFFGEGLNHHELMTRFRPLNLAMQSMARRIAGIGTLPDEVRAVVASSALQCDVLVVGAGPSGLAAAAALQAQGVNVRVLEEDEHVGGHIRYAPPGLHDDLVAQRAAVAYHADALGSAVLTRHSAAGFFHDGWLAVNQSEVIRVNARAVLFATGAREGSLALTGGDKPGVITSRALARLLANGVLAGRVIAFVGDTRWSRSLLERCVALGATCLGPFAENRVVRVRGGQRVSGIEVMHGDDVQSHACDLVVTSAPLSAAYELAAQAGALLWQQDGGFFVNARAHDGATVVSNVFAIGECAGVQAPRAWHAQASEAARAIVKEIDHV